MTGYIVDLNLRLADCVAASSAFPPVFSTFALRWYPHRATHGILKNKEFENAQVLFLSDGGTIDNTGFEALGKEPGTLLISDAGKSFSSLRRSCISKTWLVLTICALLIASGGAELLGKRWITQGFMDHRYAGTYWSIGTAPERYMNPPPVSCTLEAIAKLATMRTRLNRFIPADKSTSLILVM